MVHGAFSLLIVSQHDYIYGQWLVLNHDDGCSKSLYG